MRTGLFTINNARYICDSSGALRSNEWVKLDGKWYFANSSGSFKTGWLKSKDKWYYLQPEKDGLMAESQWIDDGTAEYYVNKSGVMMKGWCKLGGQWYYFKSSGAKATGWVKTGGKWYNLQPDKNGGMAANAILRIDGTFYSFDSNGVMR